MDSINKRDIHVLKYFSSFVSVSCGQVINITEPTLRFCPLAEHLCKDFSNIKGKDKEAAPAEKGKESKEKGKETKEKGKEPKDKTK